MNPQPEQVLALAQQIVEQKRVLADLEDRWSRLFHGNGGGISVSTRLGRMPSETSSTRRILNLLKDNPTQSYNADTVSAALKINLGTARTNLSKLASSGEIEKRTFNTYGAKAQEKEVSEETP